MLSPPSLLAIFTTFTTVSLHPLIVVGFTWGPFLSRRDLSHGTEFTIKRSGNALGAAPVLADSAPSWAQLEKEVLDTTTGTRLQIEEQERQKGFGPPHTDALIRLFDASTDPSDIRVVFYRDDAAWCPYCQKTWLLLEEKGIPYHVKKVPLNAYGDKPAWFTRLVDGGKLPALELDGTIHTESLRIMELLDTTFHNYGPRMIPGDKNPSEAKMYTEFLQLEQELQKDWFSYTFYPVEGEALETAKQNFLDTLQKVDKALERTPGPWFLGGDSPSLVDLQYISHVERIIASVLYWRGLFIRGEGCGFDNLNRWLAAFVERPAYIATKSDYYTHVMVIPSQNGPGYATKGDTKQKDIAAKIYGLDGAWKLPASQVRQQQQVVEPLLPPVEQVVARHEAAYKLINNHKNIVMFASRGAGDPGRPSFHAELADPYAEPNEDFSKSVDICLRHVAAALLNGVNDKATEKAAEKDLAGVYYNNGDPIELRPEWEAFVEEDSGRTYYWNWDTNDVTWTPPTGQLDNCLSYLRDRIGVPRDMGQAAALQLRGHLNWAIDLLTKEKK